MSNRSQIHGAELISISDESAKHLFHWLINEEGNPIESFSPRWAVIQCTDTLVWGVFDNDEWKLASEVDTFIRRPCEMTFIESRIFNEDMEVLIWRDNAGFHGRMLKDKQCSPEAQPIDRKSRFNENDDKKTREYLSNIFLRRSNPGGRVLVTPPGDFLIIREYLSQDEYGVLRIALTRFCGFDNE